MKIVNFILAIIFVLFAYFQINDPDPWLWVLLYAYIAIISAAAFFQKYNYWSIIVGIIVCSLGLLWLMPKLLDWFQQGMPSITGSMKASTPYVEFTREFFGLLICLLVLVFQYRQMKKSPTST